MERYSAKEIHKDLQKKMVFIGGPRQVGKTTLALDILQGDENHPAYLNWDYPEVSEISCGAGSLQKSR